MKSKLEGEFQRHIDSLLEVKDTFQLIESENTRLKQEVERLKQLNQDLQKMGKNFDAKTNKDVTQTED